MEIVAAIESMLAVVAQLAPTVTTTATVQAIIDALIKLIPIIIKFAPKLVKDWQIIIGVLRSNPAAMPEQLAMLDLMSEDADAVFDAAVKKAEAADAAAEAQEKKP